MLSAVATGFLVAAAIAWLVREAAILDHPNGRSSHAAPTPRGGGLGILAGFLAAIALAGATSPSGAAALSGMAVCGCLAGLLGLGDDLFVLSERLKFVALTALSLAIAMIAGPVTDLGFALPWWIGFLGSALWVFTTANAVNFMDGSDGLMVAVLVPAALALGVMGEGDVATGGFALAAATAGFAVFNAPLVRERGSLFAGDVGSLSASVLFAGLALYWAAISGAGTVWLAPLLILPVLADVLLTMAARAKAGRRLFVPHRAHAYQLLIRMGTSHGRVAMIWGLLTMACGVLAMIGAAGPVWARPAVFLVGVASAIVLHQLVRRRARAAGLDTTQ